MLKWLKRFIGLNNHNEIDGEYVLDRVKSRVSQLLTINTAYENISLLYSDITKITRRLETGSLIEPIAREPKVILLQRFFIEGDHYVSTSMIDNCLKSADRLKMLIHGLNNEPINNRNRDRLIPIMVTLDSLDRYIKTLGDNDDETNID